MNKVERAIHPYTFRSRTLLVLLICTLLAFSISLICAVGFGQSDLRDEMINVERSAAIHLLELNQKTDLSLQELISMVSHDSLHVSLLTEEELRLSAKERELLSQQMILTRWSGLLDYPVTYVQLSDAVMRITTGRSSNLLLSAFFRISFALLSFLTVFALMAFWASYKISRPISELMKATEQVQAGDFSVRLSEEEPGEVGALVRSFNGMTEALSRTAYLQKDFISSISHEFRTPIASIRGFARLLQMPGLTQEERDEYVQTIAQESDRLSRLSDTLLRLSALEQQETPASLSTFRLDEQLRQVILRLEPIWSARNMDWQLSLSPVTITADGELLTQVWINLLQNAIKFSPDGGIIEVCVSANDMAEVEIADHGIGMDEATVQRIFDRFYQADSSRSREGIGLGLCLVQRILVMLQGEIHVRSTPGEGSVFRVRIPLKPTTTQWKERPNVESTPA